MRFTHSVPPAQCPSLFSILSANGKTATNDCPPEGDSLNPDHPRFTGMDIWN